MYPRPAKSTPDICQGTLKVQPDLRPFNSSRKKKKIGQWVTMLCCLLAEPCPTQGPVVCCAVVCCDAMCTANSPVYQTFPDRAKQDKARQDKKNKRPGMVLPCVVSRQGNTIPNHYYLSALLAGPSALQRRCTQSSAALKALSHSSESCESSEGPSTHTMGLTVTPAKNHPQCRPLLLAASRPPCTKRSQLWR